VQVSTVRITERDQRMLAFAAEHRFVVTAQLATLLEMSVGAAATRLRALTAAGYLTDSRPLTDEPTLYQITTPGLRAIASDLTRPRAVDLARFRHDAGLAWLTVGAERGMFGPLAQIVSERRMRSLDAHGADAGETFGVRRANKPGLHYPDLLVITDSVHRVAFELELTTKSPRRREAILAGYAVDRRIDAVIYLVDTPQGRRAMQESVRRMGLDDRVRVEQVSIGHRQPPVSGAGALQRRAVRGRPATARER
jgi:hypothetical protein